jgi:acyl-CoA synthetase (NDP forming)
MDGLSPVGGKAAGGEVIEYFLRPRSVAIIGVSSKPDSAGVHALNNLVVNNFSGDVYLVGRSGGEIGGRRVLKTVDELPEGVDLAIFALPAAAVNEAMEACGRRKVRAAIVFASGFAEIGEREKQDELVEIAKAGNVALLGPNCLGYYNYVDGFSAFFMPTAAIHKVEAKPRSAVAVVSQSGGLASHIKGWLQLNRHIPVSYNLASGNEAGVGLADFVDFCVKDETTASIVVYVEEVRQPEAFLAAARRALAAGKPVLMMHPGSSDKGREAVNSHTGALAGNHAVMRTFVSHAGIMFVDTIDELIDACEIVTRYPKTPVKGPGVMTFSGAFCAIAHDFLDNLGIDVPPLSAAQDAELRELLPSFATPRNPLDLTTEPVWRPELVEQGARAMLADPAMGSLIIVLSIGASSSLAMRYLDGIIAAVENSTKPVVFAILGGNPMTPEFLEKAKQNKIIISLSADRSMRAISQLTFHGRAVERAGMTVAAAPVAGLPTLAEGTQPEWVGKQVLKAAGVPVPVGELATTRDHAVRIANSIGYPVVMKAQAAKLAHKTEAGGVILNLADSAAVLRAWQTLVDNVERYQSGLQLDGVLVEQMSSKGLEFIVGSRRDPVWGPVLLVGAGGILTEAIGDVRLLPVDLSREAIVTELYKLKTARLLDGFRGSPPVDVEALADVAVKVGDLMRTVPEIVEIDINPVFVHPRGRGVTALDALIVTA